MNVDQIRRDLLHLAGHLVHRGAQTEEERHAAEFIRGRFLEYTPDVEYDEFHSIDNFHYLFASYYSEFLVVSILAIWWPAFAACYGLAILVMYLAEFMGYRVFSRVMPQYDSQNVIARFPASDPARLLVVTAHYDSGCASPLTDPAVLPWLRRLHWVLLACMGIVIATCAADAMGAFTGVDSPYTLRLRWGAACTLLTGALALFLNAPNSEDVRGANNNASGVAALLRLAERLAARPIENAEVWLVATGSHEAWMGGAHHLVTAQETPKANTYLLNIESVGAGALHFLNGEGMLQYLPSDPEMLEVARQAAPSFGVTPGELRAVPTGLHGLLSRGHRGMTIIGLNDDGLPPHWNWHTDRISAVDEPAIANAADFAEAVLRGLGGNFSK